MKRLMCSKITPNPHKEEYLTEIPERTFAIDGYNIEEGLEGIMFTIQFNKIGDITNIDFEDPYWIDFFKNEFSTKKIERIYNSVENMAKELINNDYKETVKLPSNLKEKYFKNGINCAYIIED